MTTFIKSFVATVLLFGLFVANAFAYVIEPPHSSFMRNGETWFEARLHMEPGDKWCDVGKAFFNVQRCTHHQAVTWFKEVAAANSRSVAALHRNQAGWYTIAYNRHMAAHMGIHFGGSIVVPLQPQIVVPQYQLVVPAPPPVSEHDREQDQRLDALEETQEDHTGILGDHENRLGVVERWQNSASGWLPWTYLPASQQWARWFIIVAALGALFWFIWHRTRKPAQTQGGENVFAAHEAHVPGKGDRGYSYHAVFRDSNGNPVAEARFSDTGGIASVEDPSAPESETKK